MEKELTRLEITVPASGYPYLEIKNFETPNLSSKTPGLLSIRVKSGRSFLSGYKDAILFDGVMNLELKLTNSGDSEAKLEPEVVALLVYQLRELLPNQWVKWSSEELAIELSLLESTTMPVDQSSKNLLAKIAEKFQVDRSSLVNQASWKYVSY